MSHPTRGAWIEINWLRLWRHRQVSHPTRGAWIEILSGPNRLTKRRLSHPTRGAWIEIYIALQIIGNTDVAPHTGCVD